MMAEEITDAHRAIYCLSKMFAAMAAEDFTTANFWKEEASKYADDHIVLSADVLEYK